MSTSPSSSLPSIIGLPLIEIERTVRALGYPAFHAKQIWEWLYHQGVTSFEQMSNLSQSLRQTLQSHFNLSRPRIVLEQRSTDGTIKWLLGLADGNEIEAVFIPETDRGTLCVSSQVGCTLTCSFCHTGTQRMVRNLTAGEIISQLLLAKDRLEDWPASHPNRRISNVVMMGMGEPLLNYDAVIPAIQLMMNEKGIGLSKRRITLSTSGIVPNIIRCGTETGVNLAISLHATTDTLRNTLVPINKKYPLASLLEACRNYPHNDKYRRITFEYVMLKDINDTNEDAKRLVSLIEGIPAKVNLIPFNPWPGTDYVCSDSQRMDTFATIIRKAGIEAPIRTPRGQDILAACGQLKSQSMRLKNI